MTSFGITRKRLRPLLLTLLGCAVLASIPVRPSALLTYVLILMAGGLARRGPRLIERPLRAMR